MKQLITNPYILDQYSFDTKELIEDRHGRITVPAKIMKVGQLKYMTPSGQEIYANISFDDLEKAKATITNKPVTIGHPPVMLNPDNVMKYQQGISADNARIEEIDGEQWLVNDLILQTTKAKNTVKEGKLGISAGYYRDAVSKGLNVVDFKSIDGNHIAIGSPSPRAKGAGISLDSSESDFGQIIDLDTQQPTKGVGIMKRKLNAVSQGFSMDEASIDHADDAGTIAAFDLMETREKTLVLQARDQIEKQNKSFDDMKTDLETKNSELSGESKALKTQVDELTEAAKDTISMDDALEYGKKFNSVETACKKRGIETEFKTIEAGMRLCVEK
ncbi:unnamed protein product, partial [marine sediment metagenome]